MEMETFKPVEAASLSPTQISALQKSGLAEAWMNVAPEAAVSFALEKALPKVGLSMQINDDRIESVEESTTLIIFEEADLTELTGCRKAPWKCGTRRGEAIRTLTDPIVQATLSFLGINPAAAATQRRKSG